MTVDTPFVESLVSLGAVTAMFGVVINLILGLLRVVLAMGRRHDLPTPLTRLSPHHQNPAVATITIGVVVATVTCIGDIWFTWSYNAATVLCYYAFTNLSATRLSRDQQRYPRLIAWVGLLGCMGLSFFIEPTVWLAGLAHWYSVSCCEPSFTAACGERL